MVDRVTEIRDASDYMGWIADVASDWPSIEQNVGILADAALAYADLLEGTPDSEGDGWTYLSYYLATAGVPCDTDFCDTDDYESDPWRPEPNHEGVRITLDSVGAGRLVGLLKERLAAVVPEEGE